MDTTGPPRATTRFSDAWPQLSARLRRVLHARRIPSDMVDDLVQETGLRLYRRWDGIAQDTLWPLAKTVLLNLIRDEMRKQEVRQRHAAREGVPAERNFDDDILSRLELRSVCRALAYLSPVDRQLLLAEWGQPTEVSFTSKAALKMARMRARQRLRAALDRASASIPMWRLRRVLTESNFGTIAEQFSRAAAAALVVVTAAGAVLPPGSDAGPPSVARDGIGLPAHLERSAGLSWSGGYVLTRGDRAVVERVWSTRGLAPGSQNNGADDLNENFGPVRTDDGDVVVGEGGNGLGPYGVDEGAETSAGGQPIKARARARYEPPRCNGDIVIGGQSNHRCDGPGNGSAGAEGGAGQHNYGVETPRP